MLPARPEFARPETESICPVIAPHVPGVQSAHNEQMRLAAAPVAQHKTLNAGLPAGINLELGQRCQTIKGARTSVADVHDEAAIGHREADLVLRFECFHLRWRRWRIEAIVMALRAEQATAAIPCGELPQTCQDDLAAQRPA